jgi:hypothetical protein
MVSWPCFSLFNIFEARSVLNRRLLLDTHPLALVAVAFWFCCRSLRLFWCSMIGAWWPRFVYFAISGGSRGLLVNICCWVSSRVSACSTCANLVHESSPICSFFSGWQLWLVFLCCFLFLTVWSVVKLTWSLVFAQNVWPISYSKMFILTQRHHSVGRVSLLATACNIHYTLSLLTPIWWLFIYINLVISYVPLVLEWKFNSLLKNK